MKPRPKQTDEAIVEAAVREHLWPQALKWLEQGGWTYGDDPDEVKSSIDDLVEACTYNHDGFQRAKDLSDWEPDMELCEILDSFSVYSTHQKSVEAWVLEEKPTQTRKVGDTVFVRESRIDPWKQGVIDAIDEKRANYTVRIESEGHKPMGTMPTKTNPVVTGGWIVPWEEVKPTTGASEAVPSPSLA